MSQPTKSLAAIISEMRAVAADPSASALLSLSLDLRAKITEGKAKDLKTHGRYIAEALGVASVEEVHLSLLTRDGEKALDAFLVREGKGAAVRNNTLNNYRLIRAISIDLGYSPADPIEYSKPVRNKLTTTDESGRRVNIRGKLRDQVEPYAIRLQDLPEDLKSQIKRLERHYTSTVVVGRKRKAMERSTWMKNLGLIERFFGGLRQTGYSVEQAQLEDFTDLSLLTEYVNFFAMIHDGRLTYTVKDLLVWAANIAKNYFKDATASDGIWELINQLPFVRMKDHDMKVLAVTADDLYRVADCLYEHAYYYKRIHFNQKPGKAIRYPKAMCAFHVGRALVFHLSLATWLRRSNLFSIEYGRHLYFHNDALWFRFTPDEMKAGYSHIGQVRDLWRGQSSYDRIIELLNEYLELRPYLVERFLAANPDEAEPKQLFLTKYGAPYGNHGGWGFFSNISQQYLGPDKEIHPHAVRLIMPTYLIHRYGDSIFSNIQTLLHHQSSETTRKYYVRARTLFNMEDGQAKIEEMLEIQRMRERLLRIEHALQNGTMSAQVLEDLRQEIANLKEARLNA
jgi:integrase